MFLSKSCEYAIRAAVYVVGTSMEGKKASIIEIADAIGSPMHFTGKVLMMLTRKKVLCSSKGPHGGFYIEPNRVIYLIEIVKAVDGSDLFTACAMGLKECSDGQPCPMHQQMKPIKAKLLLELSTNSINEMVNRYEKQRYFLK
jgi:Rrf2 family iron-sulfur cluster assembly transcriptional regulator